MKKNINRIKIFLFMLVFVLQLLSMNNISVKAWEGMPNMSKLHVSGNRLVNANDEPVTLSGWFQPTGAYWTYQGSNYYLNQNGNNVNASVLAYMKDMTDTLSSTSPKYGSNHGWYMNFVRVCMDTEYIGDVAAGTYNFEGVKTWTKEILIPFVEYARSKGVYVTIDMNFTFTDFQCTTDDNLAKFKEVWGYIASQPEINSADNVMFELINEPVTAYANGHWGAKDDDYADHWKALGNFQGSIIQTIRNTGADNVIWCAGLGWDQFYDLAAKYPIIDPLNNYGYAVHWYPGYGANDDMNKLQQIWDETIAPCAQTYPILITETAWWRFLEGDPDYWHLFDGTTEGFGKNTKRIFTTAGNVSMVGGTSGDLLNPDERSTVADPTEGLKSYGDGDTTRDGMSRFIFDWFYERAQAFPNGGVSNGIESGATYKIINRNSGKAIDVPNGTGSDGLQLQQYSDNGATAQQWIVTDTGDGNYEIKSVCSPDNVIEVPTNNDWEKIQLGTDVESDSQRFKIYDIGNGYWNIYNTNSNKCIDVVAGSSDDAAQLIQYSDLTNTSQQWEFIKVASANAIISSGTYKLTNGNSNSVIGISEMSTTSGAVAIQWADNGTADHEWKIDLLSNSYYKLTNVNSGKVLGIKDMSLDNGGITIQWDDNGTADHEWQIVPSSNGSYKLVNRNSNKVLGIEGMSLDNGANVVQWDDNGTVDHSWIFKFVR